MDTQRQNFWKESIHKEATVRLLWHMKFSKEFARDHNFLNQKKSKLAPLKVATISTSPINTFNLERYPKVKAAKAEVFSSTNEDKLQHKSVSEMRPVTPSTRDLLFKGFSALGEGRYQYLQKRKQKKPEQKYEFPITSGWEYGWKVTTSMKNSSTRPAEFGRTRIVKDSFYRTNGVLPMETITSIGV